MEVKRKKVFCFSLSLPLPQDILMNNTIILRQCTRRHQALVSAIVDTR